MDESQILICNLSKGIVGHDASTLLGSLLISSLQVAAMSPKYLSIEDVSADDLEEEVAVLKAQAEAEEAAEPPKEEAVVAAESAIEEAPAEKPGSFHGWLRMLSDEPEAEPEAEKPAEEEQLSKRDLIDRFLQQGPVVPEPKNEFFSPSNMARMSLVENEAFVTETLADIYAKQGHTEKAINAYEQLSFANPEKSSYFAARIKELKALLRKKK